MDSNSLVQINSQKISIIGTVTNEANLKTDIRSFNK